MNENNTPPTGGVSPAELAEQLALKQKEIDDLKTMVASLEEEKSKRMPVEDVQKLVASESQKIAAAEVEKFKSETAKAYALDKLTAARKELNLETKADDYKSLTAADLDKLAKEFSEIKLSAAAPVTYPNTSSPGTVGRWDSKKREWVI